MGRLFSQNDGAFGRNLKALDIEYSYSPSHFNAFQRALERCIELEELHLNFGCVFESDFCSLRKLRKFRLTARKSRTDVDFDLLERIWANYPALTSLELNTNFLYPTTCPDEGLKAIFSKLIHFKISEVGGCITVADIKHLQFVERILPFCSANVMKSLHFKGLLHADRDEHPKLEKINDFKLARFSTSCEAKNINLPHRNSISFFELSWSHLQELELSSVSDCCFEKICGNCPGLTRLKISSTSGVVTHSLNLDSDDSLRVNTSPMFHPAFDLALLSSLTRLRDLEVTNYADSSEIVKTVLNELFKDCNRAFPRDPCGDRLTTFPAMENFRFVYEFMQLQVPESSRFAQLTSCTAEYILTRTCVGEIKRFIRTDYVNRNPHTNLSFGLKPSDVSGDKDMPEDVSNALSQRINDCLNIFR